MSYQALYRKFRPTDFTDVKGQDPIVRTLSNQVKTNRLGHAYLFCGTRGTGKTSVAKVLARAINCENPKDGNPCNECPTCKSILAGTNMSVSEIDAASNNGVDNVRQIIEEVKYSPTDAKYRVFIIDEVHMMTTDAFNALLKTLEEPPSYAVFILATTEAHKIPITILSRCQRYDFLRISLDTITARLRELCDKEGIKAEENALKFIAKCGDGSMRDALSLLERCVAFYFEEELTYDKILELVGTSDIETFAALLRHIREGQVGDIMRIVEEQVVAGRDLARFIVDFTWYMRNLLLAREGGSINEVLEISSEQMEILKHEAQVFEMGELMRNINICAELTNRLRYATQKRVLVETELIRMAKPQMDFNTDALTDRIRKLEARLTDILERGLVAADASSEAVAEPVEANYEYVPEVLPEDVAKVVEKWTEVKNCAHGSIKQMLISAKPSIKADGSLLIIPATPVDAVIAATDPMHGYILDAIEKAVGKRIEFALPDYGKKDDTEFKKENSKHIDLTMFKSMGIDVKVE